MRFSRPVVRKLTIIYILSFHNSYLSPLTLHALLSIFAENLLLPSYFLTLLWPHRTLLALLKHWGPLLYYFMHQMQREFICIFLSIIQSPDYLVWPLVTIFPVSISLESGFSIVRYSSLSFFLWQTTPLPPLIGHGFLHFLLPFSTLPLALRRLQNFLPQARRWNAEICRHCVKSENTVDHLILSHFLAVSHLFIQLTVPFMQSNKIWAMSRIDILYFRFISGWDYPFFLASFKASLDLDYSHVLMPMLVQKLNSVLVRPPYSSLSFRYVPFFMRR